MKLKHRIPPRRFYLKEDLPEVRSVFSALLDLEERKFDLAHSAFAPAVALIVEQRWIELGLRLTGGVPCVNRLFKKRCRHTLQSGCRPPGTDHPSLWSLDGTPAVYVSQPYYMTGECLEELLGFAKERGLVVRMSGAASWHNPGKTLSVQIWNPDMLKKVPRWIL